MGTNIDGGVTAKGVILLLQNCRGVMLKLQKHPHCECVEFQKVVSVKKARLTFILAGTYRILPRWTLLKRKRPQFSSIVLFPKCVSANSVKPFPTRYAGLRVYSWAYDWAQGKPYWSMTRQVAISCNKGYCESEITLGFIIMQEQLTMTHFQLTGQYPRETLSASYQS